MKDPHQEDKKQRWAAVLCTVFYWQQFWDLITRRLTGGRLISGRLIDFRLDDARWKTHDEIHVELVFSVETKAEKLAGNTKFMNPETVTFKMNEVLFTSKSLYWKSIVPINVQVSPLMDIIIILFIPVAIFEAYL